jgi:hypothetical protein
LDDEGEYNLFLLFYHLTLAADAKNERPADAAAFGLPSLFILHHSTFLCNSFLITFLKSAFFTRNPFAFSAFI